MTPLDRWTAAIACAITGAPKAVLMAVAFHDGGKAGCTASVPRLAREAGLSPNATRRALHAMVELGLLSCKAPEYGTKVYRVQWDAVAAYVAPERPARKKAETPPAEVAPLPQSDPYRNGTPTTDGGSPSQKGSPPLPEMDPNQETNLEENQEVLLSNPAEAEPDPAAEALKSTWEAIQAVRKKHQPRSLGQAFSTKRRENLKARMATLRKAKLDPVESLLIAAEWVYTSQNMRANGARKTGDPVGTMLKRAHCLAYVELALEERSGVQAPSGSRPTGAPLAWQHIMTFTKRGDLAERIRSGRLGPDENEHAKRLAAIRAAGGFPAFRMLDNFTERKVREAFLGAYNGGAA